MEMAFGVDVTPGSPPLARGTHYVIIDELDSIRLTPARAGNTLKSRLMFQLVAAHPRSRGEHLLMRNLENLPYGSPPLARGTLAEITRRPNELRLTPARAGNTR